MAGWQALTTEGRQLNPVGRLALVLGLALAMAGCSAPSPPSDRQVVEAAVEQYNRHLADGYRAMNMEGMRSVATTLQAEDEYIHMSSLAEGGARLDPELVDMTFTSISVDTTSAKVETKETWDYRTYSRATGELVQVQEGLVYDLAWDLVREGGRWLVSDIRAISATTTVPPTTVGTLTPTPPEQ